MILKIWLYAMLLLLTTQLGMVMGIVLNTKAELSLSLCIQDAETANQPLDFKADENTTITLIDTTDSKCTAHPVDMVVHYQGSWFGFSALDERISSDLSARGIKTTGKSLRTEPDPAASTLYGFVFSSICALVFLGYQRRKAILINRPQLTPRFRVILPWAAGCLAGLITLSWLPFQVFIDYISLPDYLFVDSKALQGSSVLWIYMVILGPLVEEIAFRAWLLEAWEKYLGPALALVMSAVAFSLIHPMGPVANLLFVVPGLILGALWLKTRSLLACYSTHASYNAFVLTALFYGY